MEPTGTGMMMEAPDVLEINRVEGTRDVMQSSDPTNVEALTTLSSRRAATDPRERKWVT